ncbi:MAG: response regulator transcription factor [Peptococcaceae bacterium]|nr:response regulator transcription factor [Peptococcaceae bacterium]
MERILIIEDDNDLREGLTFAFEMEGYMVENATSKCEGLRLVENNEWSLIILDCNLPDGNGFELVQEIKRYSNVPLFMLTARNTEMDEVKALELGVRDFMSKPFSLAVLKARVRRILSTTQLDDRLTSGGVMIDRMTGGVSKNGVEIMLTKIEYRLLVYLMENRGQVLTKNQILRYVWDLKGSFVDDNTLAVTVRRLRAKIEMDPKHPKLIHTIHGIGYIWKDGNK